MLSVDVLSELYCIRKFVFVYCIYVYSRKFEL